MHYYRYGTLMRPPGPGAVPREGLDFAIDGGFTNRETGHYCWGTATYKRPLTDKEIADYELEYITDYEAEDTD